jgi:hypothetical protein
MIYQFPPLVNPIMSIQEIPIALPARMAAVAVLEELVFIFELEGAADVALVHSSISR